MCACSQERSDILKGYTLSASAKRQLTQMTADLSETLHVNDDLCDQLESRDVLIGGHAGEVIRVCLHLHFYFRSQRPTTICL